MDIKEFELPTRLRKIFFEASAPGGDWRTVNPAMRTVILQRVAFEVEERDDLCLIQPGTPIPNPTQGGVFFECWLLEGKGVEWSERPEGYLVATSVRDGATLMVFYVRSTGDSAGKVMLRSQIVD